MAATKASLFDVRDIWSIVWTRKWLIVIPLILVTAVTYAFSYLIQPEYEASTIIAVDQEVQLTTDLQRLLSTDAQYRRDDRRRDELSGYFNELTSMLYLQQLVERLKLDQDPELDAKARQLAGGVDDSMLASVKLSLLQTDLQKKLSVQYAAQDQIMITAASTSPKQARDIVNELGSIFISEKLKQELTSLRSSQDFSDIQLLKYESALQEKINQRTKVERQLMQIRLGEAVTTESNRNQIRSEIDGANDEVDESRRLERTSLDRLAAVNGLSTANLALTESESLKQLKTELRDQLRGTADQMTKYTWSDPQVINSRLRQNNILTSIEEENRAQIDQQYSRFDKTTRDELVRLFNTRATLDYLYAKVSYLSSAMDELISKMNLVPELQAQMSRLDEEIVAATDIRDRFKRQQESSTISQALLQDASAAKFKVVEPAKQPLKPIRPNRVQILMMGIALGLVIGVGAAIVVELMDNSLKKVEEVEEYLGLPVLGIAPKIDFMKKLTR